VGLLVKVDGSNKEFELVEDLLQPGVLADVVDKGEVENTFKPGTKVHKAYFVWIVVEEDSDGNNKRVFQSFTVSMNPKATLRKLYKSLTGKTDEEIDAMDNVDLEALIGTKRMLVMSKEDGDNGKPYVKITATMPLKRGQTAPDIPADFVRKQDKDGSKN